jgi:glycosyltransferase involved in cell wall biosynthesis
MTRMGRLVPPANAEALAQALISLLDNPQEDQFDPDALLRLSSPQSVAEEYEALFKSLRRKKIS